MYATRSLLLAFFSVGLFEAEATRHNDKQTTLNRSEAAPTSDDKYDQYGPGDCVVTQVKDSWMRNTEIIEKCSVSAAAGTNCSKCEDQKSSLSFSKGKVKDCKKVYYVLFMNCNNEPFGFIEAEDIQKHAEDPGACKAEFQAEGAKAAVAAEAAGAGEQAADASKAPEKPADEGSAAAEEKIDAGDEVEEAGAESGSSAREEEPRGEENDGDDASSSGSAQQNDDEAKDRDLKEEPSQKESDEEEEGVVAAPSGEDKKDLVTDSSSDKEPEEDNDDEAKDRDLKEEPSQKESDEEEEGVVAAPSGEDKKDLVTDSSSDKGPEEKEGVAAAPSVSTNAVDGDDADKAKALDTKDSSDKEEEAAAEPAETAPEEYVCCFCKADEKQEGFKFVAYTRTCPKPEKCKVFERIPLSEEEEPAPSENREENITTACKEKAAERRLELVSNKKN